MKTSPNKFYGESVELFENPNENIEVCSVCGSELIDAMAYIMINTKEFVDWIGNDNCFCHNCGEGRKHIKKSIYLGGEK